MIFTESTHSYHNTDGEKYIGVTTFISKFEKKQDWGKIAEGYLRKHIRKGTLIEDLAKKWSITKEQAREKWGDDTPTVDWLLNVWKDNSHRSLTGGSTWHEFKEKCDSVLEHSIYNPVVNDKKTFIEPNNLKCNKLYLELGIGSHIHKIWGQADKVNTDKNCTIHIRDWKTNKNRSKLNKEGVAFYSKELNRKIVKTFLPPISHIVCNEWWKYALQLSMYAYFLELYGYTIGTLTVDYVYTKYVNFDNVGSEDIILFEEPEFNRVRILDTSQGKNGIEEISMPYLKDEIQAMLKVRLDRL